ncbi:hypothetical protein BVRB_2g039770 [Beta vulgaris subsp. vulgaris]|nr:hypothetical protein BVRB_2g039770 [Beta vulgaris subsp. vulgaris]
MIETKEREVSSLEIQIQTYIRRRNIVTLLRWACNRRIKLLFFNYISNGSLSSLLHGAETTNVGEKWEIRYNILVGVAHAIAYLHHDCKPPIIHRDVKSLNVLLGPDYEPYLTDFGLAVATSDLEMDQRPNLRGSYGYMSPELALTPRITEKRDVYSFGVLAIESFTVKHPLDNFPEGSSLVQWVQDQIRRNVHPTHILDEKLIEMFDDPRILLEMQET